MKKHHNVLQVFWGLIFNLNCQFRLDTSNGREDMKTHLYNQQLS